MRVNVYAEEITDRVEIIAKEIDGQIFTGCRFYLELPVTRERPGATGEFAEQLRGPFIHRPGDDDSAAVTFWGKRNLRPLLQEALRLLDAHYGADADGLKVGTEGSDIVIRLPIAALPHVAKIAFELDSGDEESRFVVTNAARFADEVVTALKQESEDGTTLVHTMLDKACVEALEQGAEGVEETGT